MTDYHIPVMNNEVLRMLNIKDNGVYIDATLGGAGHSESILKTNDHARIFAFDKDKSAIEYSKQRLKPYESRYKIFNDNFVNLRTHLALSRIKKADGILFDLGVSSYQIDNPLKGFSFSKNGKLDMRMNQMIGISAFDVINNFSFEKLAKIFREYGEEKEAARIANRIVSDREATKIETTVQLAEIIEKSTHSRFKIKAKARIFQALRIYVNNEMKDLESALKEAVLALKPKGRIVVISYHSLEDRIVKKFFKEEEKECQCPASFPKCVCNKVSTIKIISRKPIVPSSKEINMNSRAKSAKLRVAEKKELL